MWCRHKWQEQSRGFVPSPTTIEKCYVTKEMFMKLTNGYTVIMLKCKKCGDIESREVMGNQK